MKHERSATSAVNDPMEKEGPMPVILPSQEQMPPALTSMSVCMHRRIIEDVRTSRGVKTGKVRCLECGIIFSGPDIGKEVID